MAFRRFIAAYRSFFKPEPVKPPFLHVCQVGDPVLRTRAELVDPKIIQSKKVQQVIKQMREVMRRYEAVGLAAPQIGIPLRIIAIEFSEKIKQKFPPEIYHAREMTLLPFLVFINPSMKVTNFEKVVFPESCESLKGYSALVPRYREISLKGLDPNGESHELEAEGWIARIVQHEMDHLEGKLYIDEMDKKSFQNDAWHRINVHQGRVKIVFHGNK